MNSGQKRAMATLLVLPSLALYGCTRSREAAGEIRRASLHSGVCTIHHVPLRRVTMYEFSDSVPSDPNLTTYKLERQFPNAELRLELKKSREYRKAVKGAVCSVCRQQSEKYLASHPDAP